MLDTVKVYWNRFDLPPGFDDEKWRRRVKDFENHETGKTYYEETLHLNAAKLDESLGHIRVTFSPGHRCLSAEFSMARIVGGGEHNIEGPTGETIGLVIDIVDRLIAWGLTDCWGSNVTGPQTARRFVDSDLVEETFDRPTVPSIREWTLVRLDTFVNFKPRSAPFGVAKSVLSNLQPTGRRDVAKINDTAYVRNRGKRKTRVVAIYDKEHEVEDKPKSRKYAELATGIIRVEVRLTTKRQIAQECGLGKDRPRLADAIEPDVLDRVLRRNLALLHIREGLTSVETIFEELAARLGKKAARRLSEFMRRCGNAPAHVVAQEMGISDSAKKRNICELRNAGLFPAAVQAAGVVEDLVTQAMEAVAQMRRPVRSTDWVPQLLAQAGPPRRTTKCG